MDQLKKALLNSYVWKGAKQKINGEIIQTTVKLVDASEEELKQYFEYCNMMLHNTSKNKPGRYVVLFNVLDQINKCNSELLLRWFRSEEKTDQKTLLISIRKFIENNKDVTKPMNKLEAMDIASKLPVEFEHVPVTLLEDACLDTLGKFNKKQLTLTFISKQGIWLSPKENPDLRGKKLQDGRSQTSIEVIKEKCSIPTSIDLTLRDGGLTFNEFKTAIEMKNDKYSNMTTSQLKLLRDRLLPSLAISVKKHVLFWESQKEKIEEVAISKGFQC